MIPPPSDNPWVLTSPLGGHITGTDPAIHHTSVTEEHSTRELFSDGFPFNKCQLPYIQKENSFCYWKPLEINYKILYYLLNSVLKLSQISNDLRLDEISVTIIFKSTVYSKKQSSISQVPKGILFQSGIPTLLQPSLYYQSRKAPHNKDNTKAKFYLNWPLEDETCWGTSTGQYRHWFRTLCPD